MHGTDNRHWNHLNQPSPHTLSLSCGHCCCFGVCFRLFLSDCLPTLCDSSHPLLCFLLWQKPCRLSMLFLWSLFMISAAPSLLFLLPANHSEQCSGLSLDPERISRKHQRMWVQHGGDQFHSLHRENQHWLVKKNNAADWLDFCVFYLIFFFHFQPLPLVTAVSCISAW